jgi:hypothetical protein
VLKPETTFVPTPISFFLADDPAVFYFHTDRATVRGQQQSIHAAVAAACIKHWGSGWG